MTLIKSLLLGSAAGIVAVASAQAADLPTRKAAPVEYVRVCNVGGITGWTLPGSDTCVKFSGYMTAHFIGGNISNQYNSASINGGATYPGLAAALGDAGGATHLSQRLMVEGGDSQTTATPAGVPVPFGAPAGLPVFNGSAVPISLRPGGATITPGAELLRARLSRALFWPARRIRFSIAMQSAGTSAPTSALISLRTPLTAR